MSPFGEVRFRHFFMADILCSMVKPIQDIPPSLVYLFSGKFIDNEAVNRGVGTNLYIILCVLGVLPYYFRLMQCFRRYRDTGDAFPHLVNGLKYFSSIAAICVSYVCSFKGDYWYVTVVFYIIATVYSYVWDLTMDWGLIRSSKRGKWGLRDKIMFPSHYYYFAALTNLLLRFVWILSTGMINEQMIFGDFEGIYFILSFAEAYRRAQWAIF